MKNMNHQTLSSFIWSVADLLRGDYKQSEYGTVIETENPDCEVRNPRRLRRGGCQGCTGRPYDKDALDAHTTMSTQALNS
jgi:hypothetical protein